MRAEVFRYEFGPTIPMADVEGSLVLAIMGIESLHGETETRLDAAHFFDREKHACVIDASTEVGRDFNRLFVGYLRRELGSDSFRVERADARENEPAKAAA